MMSERSPTVAENRFQGIVRNVTLTRDDMQKLLEMPLDQMDDWSPVRVELFDSREPAMERMARIMVDQIAANNAENKLTTLILPVGPVAQYPIAAEISNREGISWKNVWTFNMDEYLDWEGRPIPNDHPMSFHRAMDLSLFDLLDEELRIPVEQRWFPDPFDPDAIDAKIDELTNGEGVDICFGGIGEHGHIAFNESPDLMNHYAHLTPDEFKNSKTRVLPLNPETLVRAQRTRSTPSARPWRSLWGCGCCWGPSGSCWRRVARWPRSRPCTRPAWTFPVTHIQEHPNAKETVTLLVSQ
jgi:glucosamine-6-phosphate deaminase